MSALRPFRRQYSWASSTCRMSGNAFWSPTRISTIGRSPEMLYGQSASCPSVFFACTSGLTRSDPSRYRTRDASRSYCSASSLEMPRWRRVLCACVDASANVRADALGSRYFCASAIAVSWFDAMPVTNDSLANPPGASRTRCRRLTMGSTVAPAVFERERPSSASGSSGPRPRPRKRLRSVSHSTAPWGRPSRLSTWKAHISSGSKPPGRRRQNSADQSLRNSVSMNNLPNAGCARSAAGVDSTISA